MNLSNMAKGAARTKGSQQKGRPQATSPLDRTSNRTGTSLLGATIVSACAVMSVGWMVGRHWGAQSAQAARAPAVSPQSIKPERAMGELISLLEQTLRASRPVLLGSRDPRGPSCVSVVKRGEIQTTL